MINCPNCGKSHYIENYFTTTALGWAQEYEDGIPVNSNPNTSTTFCTCCECKHDFSYREQNGEIFDIIDRGIKPEIPTIQTPINITTENEETPTYTPIENINVQPNTTNVWKKIITSEDLEEINKKLEKLTKMVESLWEWNTHDEID